MNGYRLIYYLGSGLNPLAACKAGWGLLDMSSAQPMYYRAVKMGPFPTREMAVECRDRWCSI